jgi:hypothetical protein
MKKYFFICLMLIASNAFCALSPFYQSTKEIESILTSPKLAKKLSPYDKIQNIVKSKDGYLIITQNNFLKVDIVPIPSKMVGPIKYKIIFHEPVSLKDK